MEKFNQLCVIHGLALGAENVKEFEQIIETRTGCRVMFLMEVVTNPDLDENRNPVPNTGGRTDVLFYVHDDDMTKFAVPRLQLGIRWWEDVVKYNDNSHLYSKEVLAAYPPRR